MDVLGVLLGYLKEEWPNVIDPGDGVLVVTFDTTACFIKPSDFPQGRTVVSIRAPILMGVRPSPVLYELVATRSASFQIGTVALQKEGELNVEFSYGVLADGLTAPTLNQLVRIVGTTADELHFKWKEAFGGRSVYESGR